MVNYRRFPLSTQRLLDSPHIMTTLSASRNKVKFLTKNLKMNNKTHANEGVANRRTLSQSGKLALFVKEFTLYKLGID